MVKRNPGTPSAFGMIAGALGKYATQQAIHSVIDKFAEQIARTPAIRQHVAQVMYERENTAAPWDELKSSEREIWLRRVDVVVREIAMMTRPRIGGT